jgi:hypothetical protein
MTVNRKILRVHRWDKNKRTQWLFTPNLLEIKKLSGLDIYTKLKDSFKSLWYKHSLCKMKGNSLTGGQVRNKIYKLVKAKLVKSKSWGEGWWGGGGPGSFISSVAARGLW